jgi:tryptophan synthase beta chain
MEQFGGKPDILVAWRQVNAIGLFHGFVEDDDVRLIGVETGWYRHRQAQPP